MNFEFTGRHIDVTPALKAHVDEHFSRLGELFDVKPASAHVILEVQKPGFHRSEIVMTWRGETLTASSTDSDMYLSLTQTIDKLEKQARKIHDKLIDRSHRGTKTSVVVAEPADRAEFVATAPRIIDMDGGDAKPMTPDEAAIELDSGAHAFVAFRDSSDKNNAAVLFKRTDGNYGLIHP
ncbi:MAG: ribosome hibernation-promoting factor, HPF/YfiA family [Pyrinomonadaceae bacterium]